MYMYICLFVYSNRKYAKQMKFNQTLMSPFYRSYNPTPNCFNYPNMSTYSGMSTYPSILNHTSYAPSLTQTYVQNYSQYHQTGYSPHIDVTSAPYNCGEKVESAHKDQLTSNTSNHVVKSESSPLEKETSLTSSAASADQFFPVDPFSVKSVNSSSYTPPSYNSYTHGYHANAGTSSSKFTQHYYDTNATGNSFKAPASNTSMSVDGSRALQAAYSTNAAQECLYSSYCNPVTSLSSGFPHGSPLLTANASASDGRASSQEGYYPDTNVGFSGEQVRNESTNLCIDL